MTATHGGAEHHASAVMHHGHAMRFHREASRHYQVGKDYAHAAHQALVAHGHTMQAIEHGQKASENYAEHGGNPLSKYLDRANGASAVVVATDLGASDLGGAGLHAAAADQAEQAGRHHARAAMHFEQEHYDVAAREAQLAYRHAQNSLFYSNEAAKHHVTHNGSP